MHEINYIFPVPVSFYYNISINLDFDIYPLRFDYLNKDFVLIFQSAEKINILII